MRSPRHRALAAVALIVTAAIGLTGCQGAGSSGKSDPAPVIELPPLSEVTPLADPTSHVGSTTAVIGGPRIAPLAPAPESKLPVTVTSRDVKGDRTVTVTDASRVLTLSLSGTTGEIVHALGLSDRLIGRDISTVFPGSESLPIVTKDGHSIDAESVMALSPTLIITDGSIGPTDVVLQLADAGVTVVTVERAVDSESSYRTIQQIADALGVGEVAPAVIETLRADITTVEAEIAALLPADRSKLPRVVFLYVRGNAGIFYLFGKGSGVDGLIRSIGAIDAAAEIGWVGERPMTEEALVAMNPDIILVMTEGLEGAGGIDGLLAAQPSIGLTKAGKNRRIIDVDDAVLFAGGTRIPDVIDGLARAVYAPDSLK